MHRSRALAVIVLAGCGRVGFDARSDGAIADGGGPDTPNLPICFSDDFSDGVGAAWVTDNGRWSIGPGPTGPAWTSTFTTGTTFTSLLSDPFSNVLDLDMLVQVSDRSVGDFFVQLINGMGKTYQISLFPIGGDNPTDSIERADVMKVFFATGGNALPATAGTWSPVRLVYQAGTFDVLVDGTPHLHGIDTAFSPPFGFQIGFTFGGAFDNLVLRCQ